MKTREILLSVYSVLVTIICVSLIGELKDRNEQLIEETIIKYEYAVIIDSLMSEQENFIEYLESKDDIK